MEQRQLGDSGLYTSALGFGTWEMSTTMYGHIDIKEASDAVSAAIDHGAQRTSSTCWLKCMFAPAPRQL